MRRRDTAEIRAYVSTRDVVLIDELAKKLKKPKGVIIEEFLLDSPKWQEKLKKFYDFSEKL